MENTSGVYKLEWDNGYFYIGQASSLKNRWRTHRYGFKSGHMEKHQLKLFSVWQKHGEPTFHILEYCSLDELGDVEQRYITQHWGHPLLCNTSPNSRTSLGTKRAKPPWNKGIPMADGHQQIMLDARGDQTGENHPGVKLTNAQVMEIREQYIPFKVTAQMLADKYGVTKQTVVRILQNKIWRHLPSADVEKNKALVASEGVIEFDGKSMNLRQWAKYLEVDYLTIWQRIHRYKWPVEQALRNDVDFNQGRKLTDDQVREIRARYGHQRKGSGSVALGKEYGVSHKTILGIISGKNYASVVDA